MMREDMLRRVAARAGVESTFVNSVLSALVKQMGDAMRTGYHVSLYPLGRFWSGRRKATFKKVVVKGGARMTKRIAPAAVPRFSTVRRWMGDKWDI